MPKYRVLEKSYINNSLYGPDEAAGDIVDYDGTPGKNLEGPIDEDGKVVKSKGKKAKAAETTEAPAEETADAETEAEGDAAETEALA